MNIKKIREELDPFREELYPFYRTDSSLLYVIINKNNINMALNRFDNCCVEIDKNVFRKVKNSLYFFDEAIKQILMIFMMEK